jgi:hypothetical protein
MKKKDELWAQSTKDDEEMARLSAFCRAVSEIIMMEFECEDWFAFDSAMDLHSFLELKGKEKRKKNSPERDSGLLKFGNN